MSPKQKDSLSLADRCQFIKGVGPVRAQRLKKLGIETVNDLLTHFPRQYYDRRNLLTINKLKPGESVSFLGQVLTIAQRRIRRRRAMITAAVGDETGIVQVVWFNQPYLTKRLKPGTTILLTGELRFYQGSRQIVNPEFESLEPGLDENLVHAGRIVPVYPLTAGISQRYLRDLIARTLDSYRATITDNLPHKLVTANDLVERADAIHDIHFPEEWSEYERAKERLKLEELFYMQLTLALQRKKARSGDPPRIEIAFDMEKRVTEELPFELTNAQKKVLRDIRADLTGGRGMHRLLQGDVGSGKTIVAGLTLLCAVEAGFQAAFMVPTEILAIQHAKSLGGLFRPVDVSVAVLIGSSKAAEKKLIHMGIASGEAQIVIGTHALIQEEVRFKHLGVVVIDEQHRFGVRQRATLLSKHADPHMLVMTATPIPRTLALTAYADLDLSVIDEMPPGRAPVKTRIVENPKRDAMYEFVRGEMQKGRRAYLLYPLIDETEKQDMEAAETAYKELSSGAFAGVPMGILHGRMTLAEKDRAMQDFASGRVMGLVATTVVEVGVHVPEATIMIVHHPERFGLSQLHQLRGRVGRGGQSGYCFLLVGDEVSFVARQRLAVLTRVADGFQIAAEDLKIRGPGEFLGLRQHGVPGLKIANPASDQKTVELAQQHVKALLEEDPMLEGAGATPCRRYLEVTDFESVGHTIS